MIALLSILPVLKLSIFGILLLSCHQKMRMIPVYVGNFGYFLAEDEDIFEVEEVSALEICLLESTKHNY